MDMDYSTNIENNKIYTNVKFLACSFLGKNCEFINCEFMHGCEINESCKFTNCTFDKYCRFDCFVKGCEFVQCKFDDIVISKIIH